MAQTSNIRQTFESFVVQFEKKDDEIKKLSEQLTCQTRESDVIKNNNIRLEKDLQQCQQQLQQAQQELHQQSNKFKNIILDSISKFNEITPSHMININPGNQLQISQNEGIMQPVNLFPDAVNPTNSPSLNIDMDLGFRYALDIDVDDDFMQLLDSDKRRKITSTISDYRHTSKFIYEHIMKSICPLDGSKITRVPVEHKDAFEKLIQEIVYDKYNHKQIKETKNEKVYIKHYVPPAVMNELKDGWAECLRDNEEMRQQK